MIPFIKKIFASRSKKNLEELVRQGAMIVDVRTKAEFENGYVIPIGNMYYTNVIFYLVQSK